MLSKQFLPIFAIVLLSVAAIATIRPSSAATTNPTGLVIPLYTYPTDGTWTAILNAKNAHPTVPIIAVINPADGPGANSDPNYVQGIKSLQAAGIMVLGYIATGYGSNPPANLNGQALLYKNWYSADGIMFDEMSDAAGQESYYSNLNSYVKSLGMTYTMGNPGTSFPTSFIGTLDSLIDYENPSYPTISVLSQYSAYSKTNFGMIAYGVTLNAAFLAAASAYVGWIWVTDDKLPNPYDSLPSYFTSLIAALDLSVSVGPITTITETATITSVATITTTEIAFANITTSTATTTATVTSVSTQTRNIYHRPQFFVAVASSTLGKTQFSGMWTTVSQNGTAWKTGFTTFFFVASYGNNYQVCVSDYQTKTFNHWDDGTTNPCKMIYPMQSTLLVAFYNT